MKTINYGTKNDCTVYAVVNEAGIIPLLRSDLEFEDADLKINYDSGVYPSIINVPKYICNQVFVNNLHK